MRLPEVERGDSWRSRALIRFISTVSGARLPDAARATFYHKAFVGPALGSWTQATMRGPSEWTVGERELMAAGVSRAQLVDAAAVASLFNIITRYSDALDFTVPTEPELDKAAGMLLKRGYQ